MTYPSPPTGSAPSAAPPGSPEYPVIVTEQKTNTLAIVAFVFSLLGLTFLLFIGSIIGAILGHLALDQIKRTHAEGEGLARAAVVISWVTIGAVVLAAIIFFGGLLGLSLAVQG